MRLYRGHCLLLVFTSCSVISSLQHCSRAVLYSTLLAWKVTLDNYLFQEYRTLMLPEPFHLQVCLSIIIFRTTTKTSTITKTIFTHLLRIKLLGNNGLQIKQNKTLPIFVIFIIFENLKETNFELTEENLLLH